MKLNELSDDELGFIVTFAKDGAAGRHILCLMARLAVGLGAVLSAVAGGLTLYSMVPHPWK